MLGDAPPVVPPLHVDRFAALAAGVLALLSGEPFCDLVCASATSALICGPLQTIMMAVPDAAVGELLLGPAKGAERFNLSIDFASRVPAPAVGRTAMMKPTATICLVGICDLHPEPRTARDDHDRRDGRAAGRTGAGVGRDR